MASETAHATKHRPVQTRSRRTRQPLAIVAVAFVVAGLVGAPGFRAWADDLPDGLVTTPIRNVAETWASVAERAGLDRPYLALRSARIWLEALSFSPDGE